MRTDKDPVKAFERETNRIDGLLAKWGVHVGGQWRARRRKLAVVLAREYAGVVSDGVFEAFMEEAKTRSLKNPTRWIADILDDDDERKFYFPEILKMAKGEPKPGSRPEPGDRKIHPGSKEEFQRQAESRGTTYSEEVFRARRMWMWSRCWGDRWPMARIADEQGITVEEAREQISAEFKCQDGVTLEEWEASQKRPKRRSGATSASA